MFRLTWSHIQVLS